MKEVLLMVGPPGCGKTAFLSKYYPDAQRISIDEHFPEPTAAFSLREIKEAYENVKHEYRLALRAGFKRIAVDQFNLKNEQRYYYIKNAHKHGYHVFVLVMPWTKDQVIAAKPSAMTSARLLQLMEQAEELEPGIYSILPPREE